VLLRRLLVGFEPLDTPGLADGDRPPVADAPLEPGRHQLLHAGDVLVGDDVTWHHVGAERSEERDECEQEGKPKGHRSIPSPGEAVEASWTSTTTIRLPAC